jgi:PleD family two-component response regulator
VARYGGEEFTVLLPNTSIDAAELVLDELRNAVPQGQTCSIGLTVWDGVI